MPCSHKHLVIHRDDVEQHDMQDGLEANCSCGPGLICPVCDWGVVHNECFIVAPEHVVDANLASPPKSQLN